MNIVKVNVENLPVGRPKSNPTHNFIRKLIKEGASLDTRVEFFRDERPAEWDFAIANIGKYAKEVGIRTLDKN